MVNTGVAENFDPEAVYGAISKYATSVNVQLID
jgi:hypothetical protein